MENTTSSKGISIKEFCKGYIPDKHFFYENTISLNEDLLNQKEPGKDLKEQAIFILDCHRLMYNLVHWNGISGRDIYESSDFKERSYINLGILDNTDLLKLDYFDENMQVTNKNRKKIEEILKQISINKNEFKEPLPVTPTTLEMSNHGIDNIIGLIYQNEESIDNAEKLYRAFGLQLPPEPKIYGKTG